jgi:hypothetical protein
LTKSQLSIATSKALNHSRRKTYSNFSTSTSTPLFFNSRETVYTSYFTGITGASTAAEQSAAAEENPDASALRETQDVVAVNGHEPSVSSAQIPVKVENVKEWRVSLHLSAAATPVKGPTEFEEFGSKS